MKPAKVLFKRECLQRKAELARMTKSERKSEIKWIKFLCEDAYSLQPLNTGFCDIDRLQCFQKGCITTICGHPGSGKTTFVLNIVVKLLQENKRCVIISMNKSKAELYIALACVVSGVAYSDVVCNSLTECDQSKYDDARAWLDTRQLEVYDGHFIANDMDAIVCEEQKRDHPADLFLIDHISNLIPTREDNGLFILPFIANKWTAVAVINDSYDGRYFCNLKDRQLRKLSNVILWVHTTYLGQSAKRLIELEDNGEYGNMELKIIKNRHGKKRTVKLKKSSTGTIVEVDLERTTL